ncbi:MAG: hypothetical protein HZB37_05705, partial [Planctomycetes bacterium]|nr:hypothetical protein [Planctomycetota bacterium]
MKYLIFTTIIQFLLLLFLFIKDHNDGGKDIFKKQPWGASDVIVILSILNIIAYLLFFISSIKILQPYFVKYQLIVYDLLLLSICSYVIKFRYKNVIGYLGLINNKMIKSISFGIGTAFGVWFVFNLLYILFGDNGYYSGKIVSDLKNIKTPFDFVKYFIVAIIIVPITEEIIFRGL